MINLHITLPGEPPIKKNSMEKMWFKFVNGRKVPLSKPYMYYGDKYVKWGKVAVQRLAVYKASYLNKNEDIFPIQTPLVVTFLFFTKSMQRKDLSNLLEAPQDILVGDLGFALPKKYRIEKKDQYQILADDNHGIIVNHGGSRVFFSAHPRIEIYVSSFDEEIWSRMFKMIHRDTPALDESSNELTLFNQLNKNLTLGDIL